MDFRVTASDGIAVRLIQFLHDDKVGGPWFVEVDLMEPSEKVCGLLVDFTEHESTPPTITIAVTDDPCVAAEKRADTRVIDVLNIAEFEVPC